MTTVLYLVLVASVLTSFFRGPKFLLFAAALLLPMTQVMPSPIGIVSAPVNVILAGLFLSRSNAPETPQGPSRLPVRGPVIAMVAVFVLGITMRGMGELLGRMYWLPFYEVARIVWYWVTPFVLYALVFRQARIADDKVLRTIVLLCQASVAGESLLTMWERVSGVGRATAHIGEANRAGAYFASAAAFFLTWFLLERRRRRWLFLCCWIFAVGGVFNSLSRGAMLAVALTSTFISLVFFATARRSTWTKFAFSLMLVLLVANITLIVPQRVVNRILFTFGGQMPEEDAEVKVDASSGERLLFWGLALKLFRERPYGYGPTTFPQMNAAADGIAKQAHNIYLQTLVEEGVQGLVALAVLIVSVAVFLWRRYRRANEEYTQALALALLGWWLAHSVAHFFVNPFFNVQIVGQFWIMFATLAVLSDRDARGVLAPREEDGAPVGRGAGARTKLRPAGTPRTGGVASGAPASRVRS